MPNKSKRNRRVAQPIRKPIASDPSTGPVQITGSRFSSADTSSRTTAKDLLAASGEGANVLREMKMIAIVTAVVLVALMLSYFLFR